jgi:hypothetical protein
MRKSPPIIGRKSETKHKHSSSPGMTRPCWHCSQGTALVKVPNSEGADWHRGHWHTKNQSDKNSICLDTKSCSNVERREGWKSNCFKMSAEKTHLVGRVVSDFHLSSFGHSSLGFDLHLEGGNTRLLRFLPQIICLTRAARGSRQKFFALGKSASILRGKRNTERHF